LFLIGRFVTIFFSETAWPNVPKNDMKHLWNKMSIRGKDCLGIDQSEVRIACGGHVCKYHGTK
jgi:hypothetical protein